MNQIAKAHDAITSHLEHRELGSINWYRDYDQALAIAAATNRPVFLLFQEIPGCSTCVNFGQDVLSHPLMAQIIEERCVPLAIFNNHPGKDAAILAHYREPSWNNPVVYIVDDKGEPLLPKLANRYDPLAVYEKVAAALKLTEAQTGQAAPPYFNLLRGDLLIELGLAKRVTYETPCFWSGETSLIQHEAVLTTEAGWIGGEEVVATYIDPTVADQSAVDRFARDQGFPLARNGSFRSDDSPQYYLKKSKYRYLPLSLSQKAQINFALPYDRDAQSLLSPQQRHWLQDERLANLGNPELYRQDIRKSWPLMTRLLGSA